MSILGHFNINSLNDFLKYFSRIHIDMGLNVEHGKNSTIKVDKSLPNGKQNVCSLDQKG